MLEPDIGLLADRVRCAQRITVLTGAGVSAASGVPTFRGAEGLWRSYRPEELATPEAFSRDPRTVWEWYDWRRRLVAQCRPNPAHAALAAWSHRYPAFTLVTQNVDDLHERAGTRNVVRFHGSLWELACVRGCRSAWRDETVPLPQLPPHCPGCLGLARPGVVWFGEAIPRAALEASLSALDCDVYLVVGTSSVVYPAAGLTQEARRRGAFTVEVNPELTEASELVDLAVAGRAEEILARVEEILVSPNP